VDMAGEYQTSGIAVRQSDYDITVRRRRLCRVQQAEARSLLFDGFWNEVDYLECGNLVSAAPKVVEIAIAEHVTHQAR
jgi:hypothetical protein